MTFFPACMTFSPPKIRPLQKNCSTLPFGAQQAPKSPPKASQMEPWPIILMTFFAKSRLCIRLHIYYVFNTFSGFWAPQFWRNFDWKCVLALGLPKKAVPLLLFLIFRRKCSKMGVQTEGERSHIFDVFRLFSHWAPFGCPWVHFPWLLCSPGIILAPFWMPWTSFWHPWGPSKWCPGNAKFNENESSNQPGWVQFCWILKSLGIILAPLAPAKK